MIQLALDTGSLLKNFFVKNNNTGKLKEDQTLITEADLAANQLILQRISEFYPNDSIISEETTPLTPPNHSGATWVIDPLDGTTNFSLGIHYWGVSIARSLDGYPEMAALFFPMVDELYYAKKDAGAFLNHERLQTQEFSLEQPVALFLRDSRIYKFYNVNVRLKPRILGSAAYNLCAVAKNLASIAFETTPKLWDIAASWLIVNEAGGSTRFYGNNPFPIQQGLDYKNTDYPVLATVCDDLLNDVTNRITPK